MQAITLAITIGDPGGIGPEIALKAARARRWPKSLHLVLIGSRPILARTARMLKLPLPPAWTLDDLQPCPFQTSIWDPEISPHQPPPRLSWRPGVCGRPQGHAAIHWIQAAASGCQVGVFDGMVTGPVCKKSLQLAGLPFPGHTEFLAALTTRGPYAMMLMSGPLRVILVTRHIPVSEVPKRISKQAIIQAAELTAQALPWLGVKNRTIGVCALNPHASDQGLLGREEIATIMPALRTLRRRGIRVAGPIPADVIFHQALHGRYGAVLAMYHDQGLAPLKMIGFENGINLTLGLPIVRTSPDHGTAFDIAGQGIANPSSMIAAIQLAARLIRRKNPWSLTERPTGRKDQDKV